MIESANMNGKNRTIFVSERLVWPSGLTIDSLDDALYWCESALNVIERIYLDGTMRTVSTENELFH